MDALLESRGQKPLPNGLTLSNVLVAREAGSVVGVVALDYTARSGLVVCAAAANAGASGGSASVVTSLLRSLISRGQELSLRDLYAPGSLDAEGLAQLGFAPVADDAVPRAVRSLRGFPDPADASTPLVHLRLETRF